MKRNIRKAKLIILLGLFNAHFVRRGSKKETLKTMKRDISNFKLI